MFQHNIEVLDKVEQAIEDIDKIKFELAKQKLEEGKKLLLKRIKVIKLADREDWLTAKLYLKDDLADNSEDEKLLSKAIKKARSQKESTKPKKYSTSTNKPSFSTNKSNYATRSSSSSHKHSEVCWGCGKQGHFISSCYKMKNIRDRYK